MDDDRASRLEVAEPLRARREQGGEPAHKIEQRQRIDLPQEIAPQELVKLQAQARGIEHAQRSTRLPTVCPRQSHSSRMPYPNAMPKKRRSSTAPPKSGATMAAG